jgi:hypothetical protein
MGWHVSVMCALLQQQVRCNTLLALLLHFILLLMFMQGRRVIALVDGC